jgi:hypothetical protein
MRTSVSNVIARSEPGESSEPIRIHPRGPSVRPQPEPDGLEGAIPPARPERFDDGYGPVAIGEGDWTSPLHLSQHLGYFHPQFPCTNPHPDSLTMCVPSCPCTIPVDTSTKTFGVRRHG